MTGFARCYEAMPPQALIQAEIPASYRQDYTKLFITALLITGAAPQAERAVEQSVELLDLDADFGRRAVLTAVVRTALASRGRQPAKPCTENACQHSLPTELRVVLCLDADVRCCFVLRILAGFSAAETAGLLALRVSDVQAFTRAAILRLAEITGGVQ